MKHVHIHRPGYYSYSRKSLYFQVHDNTIGLKIEKQIHVCWTINRNTDTCMLDYK